MSDFRKAFDEFVKGITESLIQLEAEGYSNPELLKSPDKGIRATAEFTQRMRINLNNYNKKKELIK